MGSKQRLTRSSTLGRLRTTITTGAAPGRAAMDTNDAGLAHEPLDALAATANVSALAQLGVDPGRPVGPAAGLVDLHDGVGQHGIVPIRLVSLRGEAWGA